MTRFVAAGIILGVLSMACAVAAAASNSPTLEAIGPTTPDATGIGWAINASGQVAGYGGPPARHIRLSLRRRDDDGSQPRRDRRHPLDRGHGLRDQPERNSRRLRLQHQCSPMVRGRWLPAGA